MQCGTESTLMLHFCFLYFIPGGLLPLIFCSVLISGALQLNFIPTELMKVFENENTRKLYKKYSMKTSVQSKIKEQGISGTYK